MPLPFLNRGQIVAALDRLGELAAAEAVILEMSLYGGAAMMLAYRSRELTKDVDAIVHPSATARRLADDVAAELGLHEGWLNDDVRQFLGTHEAKHPLVIDELSAAAREHLRITRPTASYLLAMKCMACRRSLPGYSGDEDDLAFLIRKMGIRSVEAAQGHVDRFFVDAPLPERTVGVLEGILNGGDENAGHQA